MNDTYLRIIDNEDGSQTQGNVCSNILLNDVRYRPNANGLINLGTLEPGLSLVTVLLNGGAYETDAEGYIHLPTLTHEVQMNGASYSANESGVVNLGPVCTGIKLNGLPYIVGENGIINLGTIDSSGGSGAGGDIHTGIGEPPANLGADADFYYDMGS